MPVVQTSVFAKFPSKWPHCYSCITLGLKKVEIDVLKIKKKLHTSTILLRLNFSIETKSFTA